MICPTIDFPATDYSSFLATFAVADSGAGLSLLSFILFKKMNIDPSKLIKTQQFNIKTATGLVTDAVLGHITLKIPMQT